VCPAKRYFEGAFFAELSNCGLQLFMAHNKAKAETIQFAFVAAAEGIVACKKSLRYSC
jgi:hypothetical protein